MQVMNLLKLSAVTAGGLTLALATSGAARTTTHDALPAAPHHAQSTVSAAVLVDDPGLPPYPFDIPDLGICPAVVPQVFEYSNGVLAPQGCVAALQQNLIAVGFDIPVITGDYESVTYTDVYNFQLAHSGDFGLVATGTADASTLAALDFVANSPTALGDNGAGPSGFGAVQPPLPITIGTVELQVDTQPTIEDLPDDCATTCDDDAP